MWLSAQGQEALSSFEVASVKPHPPADPVSNRIEGEGLYDLDLSFDDEGKGRTRKRLPCCSPQSGIS